MSKNLVIVESPGKTKKVQSILGSDYRVLSSQGHVCDIEPKGKNSLGIDIEHGYQPNYVIDKTKERLVDELRREAAKADTVWLASDEDREGEAIAWHLYNILGLKNKNTKRAVFHTITPADVQEGISNPRDIDYNLVDAQQARRVLDRIVGFELSPILWKKVTTGLSAGRVQSVVVRMVVEREREIQAFQTKSQYRVIADFIGINPGDASVLRCELNHRFSTKNDAHAFLESLLKARFSISQVERKPMRRMPAPPFTTSTLQQEAARKFKFNGTKTMRLAQSLYENGHITYMRTDSVALSGMALGACKSVIGEQYGERYVRTRQFQTKDKSAQEAHEAIRPSYLAKQQAGETRDEQRLYELIWKRTIASQMAEAEIEKTTIEVNISNSKYAFVATGEVVTFDGFMHVYVQSGDEAEEETQLLPAMALNEQLRLNEAQAIQTYAKPPHRYDYSALVKHMEEVHIGRPSTYAPIIDTIQKVKYIKTASIPGVKRDTAILTLQGGKISEKQKSETVGADSQKYVPTDLGYITNDFLVEHFPTILDYDFTANEEEQFDLIAEGKTQWTAAVDAFYKKFHPLIDSIPSGKMEGRLLGVDPESGQPVIAKISRMGACVQIGDANQGKPRFASLKEGQSIFSITLNQALELFRNALPCTLGEIDGKEVVIGEGKYGAYVRYNGKFISIPRGIDPHSISMEQAQAIIDEHKRSETPIHQWGDIRIMPGKYGAYIQTPKGNFQIPKSVNIQEMTKEEAQQIIAAPQPTRPKRVFRKKK